MQYFMLSLSIKPSPMYKQKFFISKLAITVLMAEQFIWLFFFLTQYIYSYSAAQNNTSESNSKWTFCKPIQCISFFLRIFDRHKIYSLPLFISSLLIVPLLLLPIKKQIYEECWTYLCIFLPDRVVPPLFEVSFVTTYLLCWHITYNVFIRNNANAEHALT